MEETNTTETEKKPRKPRKVQDKAPNKAKDPVGFQTFQLRRAIAILHKVDKQTSNYAVPTEDPAVNVPVKCGFYANEAADECARAINELSKLPADFKAPRAKGHGGGRPSVVFTIGQRVTLADTAMARVNELFPDVKADCVFSIATNAKPTDKLLPIVCTGIDGNLAPFFVDRAKRSELKPVSAQ